MNQKVGKERLQADFKVTYKGVQTVCRIEELPAAIQTLDADFIEKAWTADLAQQITE